MPIKNAQILIFCFVLIVLLIAVRSLFLGTFPVGMNHDEVEYMLSAKRYVLYGADLSGTPFPESLLKTTTDGIISPVPPLLLSPLYLIAPLTQLTARIPYVVINLITAGVLFLLVNLLLKNKKLSILSVCIFLLNPWSFYLSRYAADTPFALMFYLAGIYTFLKYDKWKLWIQFILFVLGFFSYHGAKILLVPLVVVLVTYKFFETKRYKSQIFFASGIVSLILLFIVGSFLVKDSAVFLRSDNIFFLNKEQISSQVNYQRKTTIESPFTTMVTNYLTKSNTIFWQKYLTTFSPEVLFVSGDPRATYRFEESGLFFLTDAIFILLGLFYLYVKSKKKAFLIISLIVISPLATAVSSVETSVINRAFLLLPLLIVLISCGVLQLIQLIPQQRLKVGVFGIVIFLTIIQFCNFLFFYFYQYPVTHQESYFLSEKILTKVIQQKGTAVFAKPLLARAAYLEHVFYSDSKTQNEALKETYSITALRDYFHQNIQYTANCPDDKTDNPLFISSESNCNPKLSKSGAIIDQKDAGELIKIYNSTICFGGMIEGYKRFHLLGDYNIESMTSEDLCHTWVKR